ncbi:MAG: LacI family DNA-binding transcriptional regulator, partial [Betaproteobacteria bacterium]
MKPVVARNLTPTGVDGRPPSALGTVRHATLRDVARAAGVSTATVSRAFNRPDAVREPLRQRVQAAASELRYIPNAAARTLASRRSQVIGIIVPSIDNANFAQGVAAIQMRMEVAGYGVLVAAHAYDLDREVAQARTMVERGVEALALVGVRHRPALRLLLGEYGIPYVCQGAYAPAEEGASVGFDNRRAAYVAARYLLGLGHRRIGMIAGITRDNDRASGRVAGVREALVEAGVAAPEALDSGVDAMAHTWAAVGVIESTYSFDAARIATRQLLASSAQGP